MLGDRHATAVCLLYSSWEKRENILKCKSFFWKDSIDKHSSASDPCPSGTYISSFFSVNKGLDTQNTRPGGVEQKAERVGSIPFSLSLSGLYSLEYLLFFSLVNKPVSGTVLSSWMVGHVMGRSIV